MGILKIALLCVVLGAASIPFSFQINSSPWAVWFGNGLGSVFSALMVLYICEKLTSEQFKKKLAKWRLGSKLVIVYDQGEDNQKVHKARLFINKHGLRIFSFLCPIFPGVSVSTVAVFLLGLDRKTYKRWLLAGVFFASGAYVWSYWYLFLR